MTAALVLDAAGARVALVARNEDQLREVAATPGNEALVFPADLGRNGGADILANNAGLSRPTAAVDLSMDEWDAVLNLDLRSVFALTRALAVGMLDRGYGRVVNVSSVLGLLGDAWAGPYSASKAGLNGLTRSLAVEWATEGVTVNTLCPGWVDTDMDGALLLLAAPASSYLTGQTIVVDGGLAAGW